MLKIVKSAVKAVVPKEESALQAETISDNYAKRHNENCADLLKIVKSAVEAVVPKEESALQAPECSAA